MNIILTAIFIINLILHIWFYWKYKFYDILTFGHFRSPAKNIIIIRIIYLSFSNLMMFDEINVLLQESRNAVHYFIVQSICALVILLFIAVRNNKITLKQELNFYKIILIICIAQVLIYASFPTKNSNTYYITQNIIEFTIFYVCVFVVFYDNVLSILYVTISIFIFLAVSNSVSPREPITLVAQHTLLAIGFNILFFLYNLKDKIKFAFFKDLIKFKKAGFNFLIINSINNVELTNGEAFILEGTENNWEEIKQNENLIPYESGYLQLNDEESSIFWNEIGEDGGYKFWVGVNTPKLEKENIDFDSENSNNSLSKAANTTNISNSVKKIINQLNELIDKEESIQKESIRQIVFQLKKSVIVENSDIWNDFLIDFESNRPNFFNNLKKINSKLSLNDLKHCALTVSMYSVKDVAKMTSVSTRSVETTKYRLKKKLNLEPNEDLYDYLINLG